MADRRRQLGGFAVLALVLLRLAIGWHFFSEGLEKVERDPATGQYRITFSAAGFLSQAKGPLADVFHGLMPDGHGWQKQLAVPHQNRPLTKDEEDQRKRENAAVAKARDEGRIEFAPSAPYHDWAARISEDWKAMLASATVVPSLTEDQIGRSKAAFEARLKDLADYLAGEETAMSDYQHELWRLHEWRAKPEATSVPFQEERIAKKAAETSAAVKPWVAQIEVLELSLVADLRETLTPEQQANGTTAAAMDGAITSPEQRRLKWVNLAATVLTIGVGICLLLGLFTRLSALAGAVFLLSIIATQPPWLPTAEPTIYQTVELAGLLVLAGTGAGRWLGLDYFSWALFSRQTD